MNRFLFTQSLKIERKYKKMIKFKAGPFNRCNAAMSSDKRKLIWLCVHDHPEEFNPETMEFYE